LILREKDVDALGKLARLGAAGDFVPAIERMVLSLGLLLGDQLAARRDSTILGGLLKSIRPDGQCGRGSRRRGCSLARDEAAGESLQPALLLVGEFGHGTC